jgi:hypothetical protein
MVELASRLRNKSEEVIAKVMDGEAIIINLATGVYYSLDNAGVAMWQRMEAGWRLDDIAADVTARYEVPLEHARRDVLRLAAELLREEIVATLDAGDAPARTDAAAGAPKLPYCAPALHTYRDMEDLLALDPPTPSLADIPWKP